MKVQWQVNVHAHHLPDKNIDLVIEWELVHDLEFDVADGFADERNRDFRRLDGCQPVCVPKT